MTGVQTCALPISALSMKEIILDNFPDAKVTIGECGALCSFYAEEGGLMVGFEKE